jgi:hypothetical protein
MHTYKISALTADGRVVSYTTGPCAGFVHALTLLEFMASICGDTLFGDVELVR